MVRDTGLMARTLGDIRIRVRDLIAMLVGCGLIGATVTSFLVRPRVTDPIPHDPPFESNRCYNAAGLSFVSPEGWHVETSPNIILVRSSDRPMRTTSGIFVITRTVLDDVPDRIAKVTFRDRPAVAFEDHGVDLNGRPYFTYTVYVSEHGNWYSVSYTINGRDLESIPEIVVRYLESFRVGNFESGGA